MCIEINGERCESIKYNKKTSFTEKDKILYAFIVKQYIRKGI